MASAQEPLDDISEIARREKEAISFIDSCIEKKSTFSWMNIELLFESCKTSTILSYVGSSLQEFQSFIESRNYLWNLVGNSLAKQSPSFRGLIIKILEDLQNRSEPGHKGGVPIFDIRRTIEKEPSMLEMIEENFSGVREFIDQVPHLFACHPLKRDCAVLNRAKIFESVIILSSYLNDRDQYFEGIGQITCRPASKKATAKKLFSLKDEVSKKSAGIKFKNFLDTDWLQNAVEAGRKFKFHALQLYDHKFWVYHMKPLDEISTANVLFNHRLDISVPQNFPTVPTYFPTVPSVPKTVQVRNVAELSTTDLELAELEKSALRFIDDFIDFKSPSYKFISFHDLESHVLNRAPPEILEPIFAFDDLKSFLLIRKHFWQTKTDNDGTFLVKKESEDKRSLLLYLSKYIDGMDSEGIKLVDMVPVINEYISINHSEMSATLKRRLLKGIEKISHFLKGYPVIFASLENESVPEDNIILINVSKAVDDIFLIPPRFKSVGIIRMITEFKDHRLDRVHGIVEDSSGQSAIFSSWSFQPHIERKRWKLLVERQEKFEFETVAMKDKICSKWWVYRMWEAPIRQERYEMVNCIYTPYFDNDDEEDMEHVDTFTTASRLPLVNFESPIEHRIQFTIESDPLGPCTVPKQPSADSSHRRSRLSTKVDASSQTEFQDERELLLRLLRNSSDLLKLVRAIRGGD